LDPRNFITKRKAWEALNRRDEGLLRKGGFERGILYFGLRLGVQFIRLDIWRLKDSLKVSI